MISNQTDQSICVIIAAYNAAGAVARAVASALAEPEVSEVIVVDDLSPDNTAQAAQSADDGSGRLKILQQQKNGGPAAARNEAIKASASAWLAVLDADDFFVPGRMKNLLAHAADADFIADDMWQVQENDITGPRKNLLGKTLPQPKTISFAEFVSSNVTRPGKNRAELGFIKPLMRRAFLDAHAIHYREHMRLGEDFELYARALANGARLLILPTQGYVSVVRAGSLSGKHTETDLLHLRDCDRELMQTPNLTQADQQALRRHYLSIDCRLQWRMLILAVKKRNSRAALAAFLHPFPVPIYLFKQLALQAYLRSFKGKPT